jgi:hypothetical protein
MRTFLIILIFGLFNNNSTPIEGKGFKGYIFDKNHFVLMTIDAQKERYTPSANDIFEAEAILKSQIKLLNVNLINQTNCCPIIHKKLRKYTRQYVGFKNTQNQRIIWVNLLWEKNIPEEKFSTGIIEGPGGCSYFWNVTVNLDTKLLYDLSVN